MVGRRFDVEAMRHAERRRELLQIVRAYTDDGGATIVVCLVSGEEVSYRPVEQAGDKTED